MRRSIPYGSNTYTKYEYSAQVVNATIVHKTIIKGYVENRFELTNNVQFVQDISLGASQENHMFRSRQKDK